MYIIIGASSGIGKEVLENLATEDEVIAVYNKNKPKVILNIRK